MVMSGNRVQGTGIRRKKFFRKNFWRSIAIILAFLITDNRLLMTPALARALGTHGLIYVIEEQDPIALIQQKLKVMQDSGELAQRNLEIQKRVSTSVERPKPVTGITRTSKSRIFTYDPTYIVKEDLYDHQGHRFAIKGSKINPLETVKLSANLVFFDEDDSEQLDWVKEKFAKAIENNSIKLILVRGAPLKLSEEFGIPVYFDQSGLITTKLGIKNVPAIVSQDKKQLRIKEIRISPSRELIEGER